ncbi:MAG TPA: DUF883 domain-containing protein [Acidithiobacillus sp.]|nr:DUF883 domain-containing protein [Acidithiobacillus sp.]
MPKPRDAGFWTKERLIADMKRVIADAGALLQATADQANENIAGLRAHLQEGLKQVHGKLARFDATRVAKSMKTVRKELS